MNSDILFTWISNSTPLFLTAVGIFSLMIGSFLNVVILRLPKMLHDTWTTQSLQYLQENMSYPNVQEITLSEKKTFNLSIPASHCPYCHHPLSALENIPIVSFIFLKGRCKACQHSISWRYPLIEGITALVSIVTAYHFGFTWTTLAALVLTWSLIALAMIDIDTQILPDDITLPLLWLGLIVNLFALFVPLSTSVMGAIAGYLFLWAVYWLFKFFTGKEGMGQGDFKLLAMLGAWLGWPALPIIIFLSSLLGAVAGISFIALKRHQYSQPLSFGPYLAFCGWVTLLWGDKITHLYLHATGIL